MPYYSDVQLVWSHPSFDPFLRNRVRDIVKSTVSDHVKRETAYVLPGLLHQHVPTHIDNYFKNHAETQRTLKIINQEVEKSARTVLNRVSNEDPYQNAVFGPFMNNLDKRCNQRLDSIQQDSTKELQELKDWSTNVNVALIGGLCLGAYAAFFK